MTSKRMAFFTVNYIHRRIFSLNNLCSLKACQQSSLPETILRCFSTERHGQKQNVNFRTVKNICETDDRHCRTEQEQLLLSVIEEGKPFNATSWKELKERVLVMPGYVNSINIDAIAMGFCISARQYHVGLSLLDQISSGKEPNLATFARFLKLCSICHEHPVPENIQKTVESVYLKLKSLYPLMDANSAEHVIHGLVLTERWREAFDLLSEIKVTCTPSNSTYNAIVKAAFDNNEAEIGWEVMNKMLLDGRRPFPSTYQAWLDLCMKHEEVGQEMMEKLLSFFAVNDLRPTKDIIGKIRLLLKRENPTWRSSTTSVNLKGVCKSCKIHLEPISISTEEFAALRSSFIDKVVVGSNVFLKTNPKELEAFQRFLERSIPYSVVIDGLNVAYSAKSKKSAPHAANLLQSAVKHFVDKSENVVLFGRKHMQSWPKRAMNYVFSNTKTFLAEDISQDDPFLLFAAMYGGLGTCFVSRDLMRGHMHLLKTPELKAIFKKWQQGHQYQVVYIAEEGDIILKPPLSFNPSVQRRLDGGWHIPYDEEFLANPPQTLDPPTQWLCIGPKAEKKQRKKSSPDCPET